MDARAIAHRFTIGTVLADAIRVYVRHILMFLAVAAVVLLPLIFVEPLLLKIDIESPMYSQVIVPTLNGVAELIAALVAEASMVTVVLRHLRGGSASYRDLLAWLPAAGVIIVGGAIVWLPDFLGRLSFYVLAEQFPHAFPGSRWIVAAPYCVGLMVYLVVLVFWCLFVPIVVAERTGLRASLTRSAQLGKGQRWRIFALLLIQLVIGMALAAALEIVVYANGGTMHPQLNDLRWTLIVRGVFSVYTMLSIAVSAAMYHHLRLREEGMDSARAVTAFD